MLFLNREEPTQMHTFEEWQLLNLQIVELQHRQNEFTPLTEK